MEKLVHTHTQGTLFAICGPDGLRVRREPPGWAVFPWGIYPHPRSIAQPSLSPRRKVRTCFLRLPERVPPARITGPRGLRPSGLQGSPGRRQVGAAERPGPAVPPIAHLHQPLASRACPRARGRAGPRLPRSALPGRGRVWEGGLGGRGPSSPPSPRPHPR